MYVTKKVKAKSHTQLDHFGTLWILATYTYSAILLSLLYSALQYYILHVLYSNNVIADSNNNGSYDENLQDGYIYMMRQSAVNDVGVV